MPKQDFHPYVFAALLALAAPLTMAQPQEVTAPKVVSAMEGVFGVTQGQRRNHTKGVCALGEFVGNRNVAAYTRSSLFSGEPIPVVVRF